VFGDGLNLSCGAFFFGADSPGHLTATATATVWIGERPDIPLPTLDLLSDLANAQMTFYSFDVAQDVFVREAATMRKADESVGIGTPLDAAGDAHGALRAGPSSVG
jgi:hypothetical protein